VQAALTGHLVLSTLHTNTAVGAVDRMKDLKVPPFLLSSCLLGVMAQRLLRRVCGSCAEPTTLTPEQIESLGVPLPLLPGGVQLMRGKGCVKCRNTGYFGRTGAFELFNATFDIKHLIARGADQNEMITLARNSGLRTLREAAVRKLAMGQTTFEEVMRMTTV
jgi:general secretion pathway protein E